LTPTAPSPLRFLSVDCSITGCRHSAVRNGLCWQHDRRKRLGLPIDTELRRYGRTPKEALLDAAISLADLSATDDNGWRLAWHRLRVTARRYAMNKRHG
jgi:hypothetical protein